jgi:uncharacterized protein (DUF4415 family)
MNDKSRNDWSNSSALDDDDPEIFDIPAMTPSFFENDKVQQPKPRISIALQVDSDVLSWFRSQGSDWQQRMVVVLRNHMESHKK